MQLVYAARHLQMRVGGGAANAVSGQSQRTEPATAGQRLGGQRLGGLPSSLASSSSTSTIGSLTSCVRTYLLLHGT